MGAGAADCGKHITTGSAVLAGLSLLGLGFSLFDRNLGAGTRIALGLGGAAAGAGAVVVYEFSDPCDNFGAGFVG